MSVICKCLQDHLGKTDRFVEERCPQWKDLCNNYYDHGLSYNVAY